MDDPQAATSAVSEVVDNTSSIPYARFVLRFLAALFLCSVVVFNLISAALRKQWDTRVSMTVAFVGTVALSVAAVRTWRELAALQIRDSSAVRVSRGVVLRTAAVVGILSLALAGIVGMLIGQNRAEAAHLQGDARQMKLLSNRISEIRSSAQATVLDQIRMYKAIEADVAALKSTLLSLDDEFMKYDGRHYSEHEETQKSLSNIGRVMRQVALLQAQIAVAKKIEESDPDSQIRLWSTEMDPLIQQENGLK